MANNEPEKDIFGFSSEQWEEFRQLQAGTTPQGVKGFMHSINTMRSLGWSGFWKAFFEVIMKPLALWWSDQKSVINDNEDRAWDAMLNFMEKSKMMDSGTAESLLRFRGLPFGIQSLFNLIVLMNILKNYVGSVADITQAKTRHELSKDFRPTLPDPSVLIRSAYIAPEKTEEVRGILAKHGFSEEAIDFLFLSQYNLYDIQTTRDLFFRKEIDEAKVYERLHEMGFTDTRIKELTATWNLIPPVPDLIRFAVREAFTPEIAEKFGQYEDFPAPVSEWSQKQGLSDEWAKRYWAAHWDLPSPQMGFEMLHRGIIDTEELKLLLRALDVMPYWRERLIHLSYMPYTRVDVRRMHKAGVLGEADLMKAYKDIGYDEEHAQAMSDFTVQYNTQDEKLLTHSQIIKGYRESMLSREETYDLLTSLRYSAEKAELYISMADYEETLELQTLYVDSVKQKYIGNFFDEVKARAELMKLNLPGARIDALMEKWTTQKMLGVKMPSKTDLDKFLKNKVIDADTYKLEMERLGYSWNYTQWYLALVEKGKAGN